MPRSPRSFPTPLRRLRDEAVTREMALYRDAYPPLPLVDRYMSRIGIAMTEILAEHPASALHLHTEARSVHLRSDGSVAVFVHTPEGRARTLIAQSAVVAVGGHQPWRDQSLLGLRFADCKTRLMPSNELLSHAGLAEANSIIGTAGDRQIVILGGSHSAYAVAWALLELPASARLRAGQLVIVQRRPPPVFYPARARPMPTATRCIRAISARAPAGSTAWAACAATVATSGAASWPDPVASPRRALPSSTWRISTPRNCAC